MTRGRPQVRQVGGLLPRTGYLSEVPAESVSPAGVASPPDAWAPLPLVPAGRSRNWTLSPGTMMISVENLSLSSPSLRHLRVWSLPAT